MSTLVLPQPRRGAGSLAALRLVAAVWALDRGLRREGSLKWLVLSGVFVGLGFEPEMAAALLVVPGLALAWLWVAPKGRVAAVKQLLAGGAEMAAVGLAWPLLTGATDAMTIAAEVGRPRASTACTTCRAPRTRSAPRAGDPGRAADEFRAAA